MKTYIPSCVGMRYERITDDNVTCVIEWVHIVSEKGQKELARISLSGISAYERGEDGLLCAIRICDYANYERTIDWTKTPVSKEEAMQMNFVKEFPEGSAANGRTACMSIDFSIGIADRREKFYNCWNCHEQTQAVSCRLFTGKR